MIMLISASSCPYSKPTVVQTLFIHLSKSPYPICKLTKLKFDFNIYHVIRSPNPLVLSYSEAI